MMFYPLSPVVNKQILLARLQTFLIVLVGKTRQEEVLLFDYFVLIFQGKNTD